MRKIVAVTVILLLAAGVAFGKAYEVNKKAGDYSVLIKMDKNPPSVGMNNVEIAVNDKGGKPVRDAKIVVEYGMPAMQGMPAMNYRTDAKPDGDKYNGSLNISMGGPWFVNVRITTAGKTVSTKYTLDVN
jgi:YtkA-like